jgi:lysophospholipid acyltransferase (LPLAT)-like uncharacterized protein
LNPYLYRIIYHLGPLLGDAYLGFVRLTSRVEVINEEVVQQVRRDYGAGIYVIWHSRLLYPAYHLGHYRPNVLISRSRDGDLIARGALRWGYEPVRGSSSRGGGMALRVLIRGLRAGKDVVITPDGPRGPRERVQPGVIALAKKSGCPVIPMSYDASRRVRLRSWDRFLAPLPFSKIRIVFGEPVSPEGGSEAGCRRVESGLQAVTREAERLFRAEETEEEAGGS